MGTSDVCQIVIGLENAYKKQDQCPDSILESARRTVQFVQSISIDQVSLRIPKSSLEVSHTPANVQTHCASTSEICPLQETENNVPAPPFEPNTKSMEMYPSSKEFKAIDRVMKRRQNIVELQKHSVLPPPDLQNHANWCQVSPITSSRDKSDSRDAVTPACSSTPRIGLHNLVQSDSSTADDNKHHNSGKSNAFTCDCTNLSNNVQDAHEHDLQHKRPCSSVQGKVHTKEEHHTGTLGSWGDNINKPSVDQRMLHSLGMGGCSVSSKLARHPSGRDSVGMEALKEYRAMKKKNHQQQAAASVIQTAMRAFRRRQEEAFRRSSDTKISEFHERVATKCLRAVVLEWKSRVRDHQSIRQWLQELHTGKFRTLNLLHAYDGRQLLKREGRYVYAARFHQWRRLAACFLKWACWTYNT